MEDEMKKDNKTICDGCGKATGSDGVWTVEADLSKRTFRTVFHFTEELRRHDGSLDKTIQLDADFCPDCFKLAFNAVADAHPEHNQQLLEQLKTKYEDL
jgi:thiol-disulfide isomerase/thioredoxin